MLAELFGAPVTTATPATVNKRTANRLQSAASDTQVLTAGTARATDMDETGFPIGGKTQCLHANCTHLAECPVGGRLGALPSGVSGIVVPDNRKPCFTTEGVEHVKCDAHHLRESQAQVDIEGKPWWRRMPQLLRRSNRTARIAHDAVRPEGGWTSRETSRRRLSGRGRSTKETVAWI